MESEFSSYGVTLSTSNKRLYNIWLKFIETITLHKDVFLTFSNLIFLVLSDWYSKQKKTIVQQTKNDVTDLNIVLKLVMWDVG